MTRYRLFSACASLAGLCLVVACSSAPREPTASSDPAQLSTCTASVTQNTYDGPNYWGTITVKNTGSAALHGFSVQFSVPSGDHCTNDTVPSGAKLTPLSGNGSSATTTSNKCVFTWSSGTLATGASLTFNYSTDNTTSAQRPA